MRPRPASLSAALTAALVLSGCAASSTGGGHPASTSAGTSPTVGNDFALRYTGGTAGRADKGKSPVVVGYINQEGAVPSFPEATAGLDAAVKYVNAELGGAQGHPITVHKCVVQTEEDGQKCATEMANDQSVKFVLIGQQAVGNKAVYSVLSGKKPIIQASPGTVDDLSAADSYAYTPGGPGVIAGMAIFTAKSLGAVKRVAVVYANNPAGKGAAQQFLKPILQKLGVANVTLVGVADNATGPDVAAAVQASGAAKADALVTFVTPPGCIAVYDALRSLHLKTKVVATGLCFGTPVTQHLRDVGASGQVPDWYYGAFGYSYFQPDVASGMTTYLAKIKQYGGSNVEYTGFAGYVFADLLTAVKFVNEVGPDKLTPEAFRAQAKSFAGPMMLTAGPMKCGYSKLFPALCGSRVGIEQYSGGSWHPTALGDKAIDVSPIFAG